MIPPTPHHPHFSNAIVNLVVPKMRILEIPLWHVWPLLALVFYLQNFGEDEGEDEARPLAESLLLAIADLLFCLDFTVQSTKKNGRVSLGSQ